MNEKFKMEKNKIETKRRITKRLILRCMRERERREGRIGRDSHNWAL